MNLVDLRLRSVKRFIEQKNIQDRTPEIGKGIYLSYSDYFYSSIFGKEIDFEDEQLTQFCLASFLMYLLLLDADDILDATENSISATSISNLISQQNFAHHLLSGLFDFNSEFWSLYSKRQKAFIECYIFEANQVDMEYKDNHYRNSLDFTFYQSYFGKKCSFSSSVIDGLYILNNKECGVDTYKKVLEINDRFNFAFCVLDDIEDYRKDIGKNQINIAHHYFLAEQNEVVGDIDNHLNNSFESFYTEGYAIDLMILVKEELERAYQLSQDIGNGENLGLLLQVKLHDLKKKMSIVREYAK